MRNTQSIAQKCNVSHWHIGLYPSEGWWRDTTSSCQRCQVWPQTVSDPISVCLGSLSQNVLNLIWKSRFCSIMGQSDPLCSQTRDPCVEWNHHVLFIRQRMCYIWTLLKAIWLNGWEERGWDRTTCHRCLTWLQSVSDWPQIGKIRDFFRSDLSTFWIAVSKFTGIWSEKSPICPNLGPIWPTLAPNRTSMQRVLHLQCVLMNMAARFVPPPPSFPVPV